MLSRDTCRALAVISVAACWAATAHSATIVVPPGPGTPVQDAINAASPGDTILLSGTYSECITIPKALKVRGTGLGDPSVILQATCAAGPVIDIQADDVKLRKLFVRNNAGAGGIGIVGRTRVRIENVSVASPPSGYVAPAVNVEQSTRVTLRNMLITHFDGPIRVGPVGIRIADTPSRGRIYVRGSGAGGFDTGLLALNAADKSLDLSNAWANGNNRGIVLTNTVGASIAGSSLVDNVLGGIVVDGTSSGNRIVSNRIESSSGVDVSDNGGGNCWLRNVFSTGAVPACP
jgi:nitrous oxidase accessory protein NosD